MPNEVTQLDRVTLGVVPAITAYARKYRYVIFCIVVVKNTG